MRKTFYLLLFTLLFFSCNNDYKDRSPAAQQLMNEMKKHLLPSGDEVNIIKKGETIALQSSEVQGIDHERYKEFDYWKEIDNNFFEKVGEKSFSDPDVDGGTETTLEIFKTIKKGETEIRFYRRNYYGNRSANDTTIVRDTTAKLYNTYRFRIE